jgi:hypothetical protein
MAAAAHTPSGAPADSTLGTPALYRSLHKQASQGLQNELSKMVVTADVNSKDDYSKQRLRSFTCRPIVFPAAVTRLSVN